MIFIKPSQFNIYLNAPDGTRLAFNSLTCGLAIIDDSYDKLMSLLPDIDISSLSQNMLDTYNACISGNFIVPDDFDELLDFETKRNVQKYSTESMGLTIAPTLACNFKCVYCYETSKPGIISQCTQDNIIKFVERHANHLKQLDVSWYGGEPLLALNAITNLSEAFLKICKQYNIEYHAFIITNGSLIDNQVIEDMKAYHIYGAQITIDGPKEIHDKRRVSKNGQSSFDTIITNINKLLANDINVVIRINVDKTNENSLEELISYLSTCLISKCVKISFGQVTAYTEACRSIENTCYNNNEFAIKLALYYQLLRKYGFEKENPYPYPSAKLNYCCADLLTSLVIDHEGYVYKCWNEVGTTERSIGNINDDSFNIANYKNGKWLNYSPIQNEQCKHCNILPLCVGGCPYNRLTNVSSKNCDLIKYNLKDVMLTYYNYAKEGLI